MDDQVYKELRKISEDVVFVKTTIENITKNNDLKLDAMEDKFEEKLKVANHRIADLEDQNKWLWRTTIGSMLTGLIAGAIALIF